MHLLILYYAVAIIVSKRNAYCVTQSTKMVAQEHLGFVFWHTISWGLLHRFNMGIGILVCSALSLHKDDRV